MNAMTTYDQHCRCTKSRRQTDRCLSEAEVTYQTATNREKQEQIGEQRCTDCGCGSADVLQTNLQMRIMCESRPVYNDQLIIFMTLDSSNFMLTVSGCHLKVFL